MTRRRPQRRIGVVQRPVAHQSHHRTIRRPQLGPNGGAHSVALRTPGRPDVLIAPRIPRIRQNVLRHGKLLNGNQPAAPPFQRLIQRIPQRRRPHLARLRRNPPRRRADARPQRRHLLPRPRPPCRQPVPVRLHSLQHPPRRPPFIRQHRQIQPRNILQILRIRPYGNRPPRLEQRRIIPRRPGPVMRNPHADYQIRIQIRRLLQTPPPGVQRMLDRNRPRIPYHRRPEPLRQLGNLGNGAALPHPVPHIQQRTLRLPQRLRHRRRIPVRRIPGAKLLQPPVNNIRRVLLRPQQPVVHRQMHRPHRRRHCHPQRPFHRRRQPFRFNHRPVRFGQRRGNRRRPRIVANIQADFAGEAARIPGEGNHHHRQTARPHINQLPHRLRQPRPQMHHHHPRRQVRLRIAPGHRRNRPLVQPQNPVYIGTGMQLVEKQRLPRPRVVENILDARSGQLLHHQPGSAGRHLPGLHRTAPVLIPYAVLPAAPMGSAVARIRRRMLTHQPAPVQQPAAASLPNQAV